MSWHSRLSGLWDYGYHSLGLRHAVPFLLLLLYTAVGAAFLWAVEGRREAEEQADFGRRVVFARRQVMRRLEEIKWDPNISTPELVHRRTLASLDWYNSHLGVDAYFHSRIGPPLWTWWGAMFFCGTIYSTIGYGIPSPTTLPGRIFTCIYALVGIPLFLVILKEVGVHLSRTLRRSWKTGSRGAQRLRRKLCGGLERDPEAAAAAAEKGGPKARRRSRLPFPWYLPLVMVGVWIAVCAAVFCIWERDWGFGNSVYFVFISLSTIGLGDVVPTKPDLMLANFVLLLIGLALISMSFSVIQIRIEELLEDMLQKFLEDYERLGDGKFELGLTGALASLPLAHSMGPRPDGGGPSGWISNRLIGLLAPRRASPAPSDSDDEERPEMEKALERWAEEKGGGGGVLLSRLVRPAQLVQLEATVTRSSVAAQTSNDLTDILHFLDIPQLRKLSRMRQKDSDAQTMVSFSSAVLDDVPGDFRLSRSDMSSSTSTIAASVIDFPILSATASPLLDPKEDILGESWDDDVGGGPIAEFRALLSHVHPPSLRALREHRASQSSAEFTM